MKLSELDALGGDGDGGLGDAPPGPPTLPVRPTPWKAPQPQGSRAGAPAQGFSLSELDALAAPSPAAPAAPAAPGGDGSTWSGFGATAAALPGAVVDTVKSIPSEGARYLMGVANLPTLPFRALADWVASSTALPGTATPAGTVGGELNQYFGVARAADPGLFSYGTALHTVMGVEEGKPPQEGSLARYFMKGAMPTLPPEMQDSVMRGVLNLVGGVLEDPTAIAGLATAGGRVAGKELAKAGGPAVAKLAGLIDTGIAVTALPGISAEGASAFARAKQAYDVGDNAKAAQYFVEGMGYLGLGGLVAVGTRGELRGEGKAAGQAPAEVPGGAAGELPPGPPGAPGAPPAEAGILAADGAPAGDVPPGIPAPPSVSPIQVIDTTATGELLGAAPVTSQTSPVLGAAVDTAREQLLSGRALDADAVRAAREAFAEMTTRQEPVPLVEIEVSDARKTLKLIGWDNNRIGKAAAVEAEQALAEVGLSIRKPDAPPVAELGTAEWERATQQLVPEAAAGAEKSLDEIIDSVEVRETGGALSADETAAARTTALDIYKQTRQGAPLFMPLDKRAEMLRAQFGDRAEAVARVVQDELTDLNQGTFYDNAEYASAAPPPDLQQRAPDFTRGGARQWVARLDDAGNELAKDAPSKDGQKLVSWVEDPATGELRRAGGIVRLRGEQHFLVHNRALGDHDLPTSFKPIKAAAEALGWRQAPASTSSTAAQRMYRNFEERGYSGNGEGRGLPDVEAGPGTPGVRVPETAGGRPEAGGVPPVGRTGGPAGEGLPGAVQAPVGRSAAGAGGLPPGPPDAPGAAAAGSAPPEAPAPQVVAALPPTSVVPPTAGNLALKLDTPPPSPPPVDAPPLAPSPMQPGPLTEPVLKLEAHRKVLEVVGRIMQERGIPWDRSRFPVLSDQIAYHLNHQQIPMPEFDAALKANGLSLEEFTTDLWRPALGDAGRRLQANQQLARTLDQYFAETGRQGTRASNAVAGVKDALSDLSAEVDAFDVLGSYGRRFINIWRGALVSQPITTARNVITQMAAVGVNSIADVVDYAIGKAVHETTGWSAAPTARPLEGLRIGWTALNSLRTFGQGKAAKAVKQLTDDVLAAVDDPRFGNRLFNTYASDVSVAAANQGVALRGVDAVFRKIEGAVDAVNVLNRGQEYIFRRSIFTVVLDGELGAKGLDLADVVTDHNRLVAEYTAKHGPAWKKDYTLDQQFQLDRRHISNFLDEDVLNKAIDKSLRLTFSESPKGKAGKGLMALVNNSPLVVVQPFPRFLINALKWQIHHSPLGALRLLSKHEKAAMAAGDFSAASQAIVGTAMLFAAYEMRQSESAGERWHDFKIDMGDGKVRNLDIRPFNPFAFHFFVADLFVRRKRGRLYTMTSEDLVAGALNVSLRAGTGLAILDAFAKGVTSIGDWDEVKTALGRVTGEFLAGFMTPLQPLADAYSQYDADSRVARDRRQAGIWGPIKSRIPGMEKAMPELELPTRSGPRVREYPLLRQLTGLNISDPQSPVEQELARLQFAPNEVFRGTKSPEADALVKHYLGDYVEEVINPTILSREYQALSDGEKGMVLAELLAAGRKEARKIASAEQPEFFGELRKRSMRQKLLEAETTGEQEAELGGPPAEPSPTIDDTDEPPLPPSY